MTINFNNCVIIKLEISLVYVYLSTINEIIAGTNLAENEKEEDDPIFDSNDYSGFATSVRNMKSTILLTKYSQLSR